MSNSTELHSTGPILITVAQVSETSDADVAATPLPTPPTSPAGLSVASTLANDDQETSIPDKQEPGRLSIVAARKLALLQKFGTTSTTSFPTKGGSKPIPVRREWDDLPWIKRSTPSSSSPFQVPQRRDSIVTISDSLSAQITGSTAVEETYRPLTSSQSVSSRVKSTALAFSQLQVKDGVPADVVKVGDAGLRPWSRLSISTKVDPADFYTTGEPGQGEIQENPSFRSSQPSTDLASTFPSHPSVDEEFDTHPPTMVSPRTQLAHVISPPVRRTKPVYIRGGTSNSLPSEENSLKLVCDSPPLVPQSHVSKPSVCFSFPPSELHEILETESPAEYVSTPQPQPLPQPTSTRTRTISTRPLPRSSASNPSLKSHRPRTESVSKSTTIPPRLPLRTSTTIPQRSPSSIASPRPRLTSLSMHTTPLKLKAENPIALRKKPRDDPLYRRAPIHPLSASFAA